MNYFSKVVRVRSLIPSLLGFIIGGAAFIESVEIINDYFEEERIVFEIQQDIQEDNFFVFLLKGLSDKNYSLETFKFKTEKNAKVKVQYDDLKKPISLDVNSKLIDYSYTSSKDKLENSVGQHIVFESQKPLFILVEFEQVIANPSFECEFSGFDLDPNLPNTKAQSIECAVEELGYNSHKNLAIWMTYFFVAIIVIVPIIYLIRRIFNYFRKKPTI